MATDRSATDQRVALEVARSLGAVVLLVGLLVVLPWGLASFVGWPLPRQIPSSEELRRALGGSSISDTVLVKALALVCWIAWAQLVACVLAEGVAWARGRAARALPLSGVVQPLARHLVVSATLLVGALRAQPVAMPVVALPAVELAYSTPSPVLQHETEPPAPEAAGDEEEQPTCVVHPRDSLWKLAEDHLGDGLRWRELWDLNRGREFPDGDVLADPDLIRPGWVLRLPPDATGGELEPGLNVGEVPDTSSPEPPTRPSPSPETVAEVPNRVARPTTARPTTTPVPTTAGTKAGGEEQGGVSVPQNLAPVIGSALAVGLVAYLGRLRLVQQRRREPGRTIPLPPESLVNREAELRREATVGGDGATRLDLTLRAIASSLAASRRLPTPSIEAVSMTDDLVEILFSSPLRAPAAPSR